MHKNILLAGFVAVWMGVFLSSCDESFPKENFPRFDQRLLPSLQHVGSCEELETQARNAAFLEIQANYSQRLEFALAQLQWADSSYCQYAYAEIPLAGGGITVTGVGDERAFPAESDSAAKSGSAANVSGTNNQISEVDEADIVKADNKHIYVAKGNRLRIFRAWHPNNAIELASAPISGQAKRLLKVGERLLVISFVADNAYPSYWDADGLDAFPPSFSKTFLTLFDVSDPRAPKELRKIRLHARFETARSIDNNAILVLSQMAPFQVQHSWWPDVCDGNKLASEKKLRADYVRALNEVYQALEQLPSRQFGLHIEDSLLGAYPSCHNVFSNAVPDGAEQTSVVRMDLFENTPLESATVLSRAGEVFVSENSVYMAVSHWNSPNNPWFENWDSHSHVSVIHKFSLPRDNPSPAYVASGLVKGNVLNTFSMDEYDGFFRIATTTPFSWGRNARPQENIISVFRQEGTALQLHGQLDNIAPTEQIYSARFMGKRAYIVTFLRVDPLFSIDLSDPANPTVLGELKIPGFSTYIHPLENERLLTVGYDADETTGMTQGLQVQLFDVSNPREPRRVAYHTLSRYSFSEAAYNHLGFAYYPPLRLLALPVADWGSYPYYGNPYVRLLQVDPFAAAPAAALSVVGNIPHPDVPSTPLYGYGNSVLRNIFMMEKEDGSGDNFLYSLSNNALFSTKLPSDSEETPQPIKTFFLNK